MATRICRHPLRITIHAPVWLDCETCQACFLHREDCPGLGTPGCAEHCMGGADPAIAALDALYSIPDAVKEQASMTTTAVPAPMDTTPLSEAALAEIRAREAAASPGHWGTHYDGQGTYSIEAQPRLIPGHGNTSEGLIATIREENGDPAQVYRNAEFIARGRTDVRTLLDEVDRLRARVAELAGHAGPAPSSEGR